MKPIASSDSIDSSTITQGSPIACCRVGNAWMSAKLAIQLTPRARGRGAAAYGGREDLALQQPAGAADAHRERRDEDREADHDDDDLRGAGQPGDPGGRDQHEHRHAGVAPEGERAPADLVDEAEAEVGRDHVDRAQDRRGDRARPWRRGRAVSPGS